MKLRIMSFLLTFTILLSFFSVYTYALENESQAENIEAPGENGEENQASPNAIDTSTWTAIIMQGDTYTPADCRAFENSLTICQNGYGTYARFGWEINSSGVAVYKAPVVSQTQLVSAKNYDVAYYSGHGGAMWDNSIYQPCLNYNSSSDKILVAKAFGVSESNWASTTVINSNHKLRVFVLASCSQLNDTNAKFYARLMKVSGIRAIPGYYSTAPSAGDDTIAANFVQNCNNGNSIASAWGNANSGHPWAVLVYFSNNNQYYRLPGFPGSTYSAPASDAAVYIVKESVADDVVTTAYPGISDELMAEISNLPLTILTSDTSANTTVEEYSREAVWTNAVPDGESAVRKALASELGDIDSKLRVVYNVTKEVVDPDIGVRSETSEIIERTYRYYDTFNGIKIADSFVGASVDSQGLNKITAQKKSVVSGAVTASAMAVGSTEIGTTVSDAQALKLLLAECPCLAEEELRGASLAYAPDGSGNHVLCYEFLMGGCFYYVSVAAGEVLWF